MFQTIRKSAFTARLGRAVLCACCVLATPACLASRTDTAVMSDDLHRIVRVDQDFSRRAVRNQFRVPGGRLRGAGDPRRVGGDWRVAQTVDPTGSYDFSLTDHGVPVAGSMSVDGTPGAFTGTIKAEGKPDVPIATLTASGSQVTVTGDVPQGVLLLRFRMSGDSLKGDWSLRGQGGLLVGKHQRRGGAK